VQESCGLNLALLDFGGNDLVLDSPVLLPSFDGAAAGGGSDMFTFRVLEGGTEKKSGRRAQSLISRRLTVPRETAFDIAKDTGCCCVAADITFDRPSVSLELANQKCCQRGFAGVKSPSSDPPSR